MGKGYRYDLESIFKGMFYNITNVENSVNYYIFLMFYFLFFITKVLHFNLTLLIVVRFEKSKEN